MKLPTSIYTFSQFFAQTWIVIIFLIKIIFLPLGKLFKNDTRSIGLNKPNKSKHNTQYTICIKNAKTKSKTIAQVLKIYAWKKSKIRNYFPGFFKSWNWVWIENKDFFEYFKKLQKNVKIDAVVSNIPGGSF